MFLQGTRLHLNWLAVLAVLALILIAPAHTSAAPQTTFVVNSTGDQDDTNPGNGVCHTSAGTCTLRAAIHEANAHSGSDVITFSIGSGTKVIAVNSALPVITDLLVIDGTTQPGCTHYPCIVLDGKFAGSAVGLEISAGNALIKGLVINQFSGTGIVLETHGGDAITGNYIGTDVTGKVALGNANGISICCGSSNNIIGGTSAAARNLISGNVADGIIINDSTTTGNIIEGNYIGTNVGGGKALGNGGSGVHIRNGSSQNSIGGTSGGTGNKIAFNSNDGVFVGTSDSSGDTTRGNRIRRNSIFSNGGLGIDLGGTGVTLNDVGDADTGPNNFQNFPVLTSAVSSTKTLKGTLNSTPSTQFALEFFANPTCDSSGYGEGKTYLGVKTVTTNSSGNVSFTFVTTKSFAVGYAIKGTATDPNGNTSEFGKCVNAQ